MYFRDSNKPVSSEENVHCEIREIAGDQIKQAPESHDQSFDFCSKGEGQPLECWWYDLIYILKGRKIKSKEVTVEAWITVVALEFVRFWVSIGDREIWHLIRVWLWSVRERKKSWMTTKILDLGNCVYGHAIYWDGNMGWDEIRIKIWVSDKWERLVRYPSGVLVIYLEFRTGDVNLRVINVFNVFKGFPSGSVV